MTDGPKLEPESDTLRSSIAALRVPSEDSAYAKGFNAALHRALELVDHHDRDRLRRSAIAIARRRAAGKKVGGELPYGYQIGDDGETLEPSPKEQLVIGAARKLHKAGYSLREVARRLRTRGMLSRDGAEFHATQIKRMLDEEKAAG